MRLKNKDRIVEVTEKTIIHAPDGAYSCPQAPIVRSETHTFVKQKNGLLVRDDAFVERVHNKEIRARAHEERKKTRYWQELLIIRVLKECGSATFHEQLYKALSRINYNEEESIWKIDCSLATFLIKEDAWGGDELIVDNSGLNRLMARMDKKGLIKLEKLPTGREKKCFLRRYSL